MHIGNPAFLAGAVQNPLIVSTNLIGYWSMNDASASLRGTLIDFSNNSTKTDGTYAGTTKPQGVFGPIGQALSFNGTTAYINIPDAAYLRPGTGNFTISCWCKRANSNSVLTIVGKRQNSGTFTQLDLDSGRVPNGSGVAGKQICLFGYDGSSMMSVYTNNNVIDGNWHHVVGVRIYNSAPLIYVDGLSWAVTADNAGYTANITSADPWQIGGNNTGNGIWDGQIDDVRLYNRALTAPEVAALYAEGLQGGTVLHPTVINWASRVSFNLGSTISFNTLQTLSNFMYGMDAAGLTSKMYMLNCVVPDSLLAAQTPLIRNNGSDPWANNGPFVASDLTINGLAPNGSNKYLNSGFSLASLSAGNQALLGMTIYTYTATLADGNIGEYDGTNGLIMFPTYTDGKTYTYNGSIANNSIVIATTPGAGYYSDNRIGATDHRLYWANSLNPHAQIGTTDSTSFTGTMPNYNVYVWGINNAGGLRESNNRMSFAAIHSGLTSNQSQTLFNLVQAMRTGLGGGYL
jgi:hypothetical protein